jgi:crotonobetainyl-CoA:carnitine CoA-transferase CaiB-like acyl-CoA transferase
MAANPLSRSYTTADGRTLWFTCLQAGKYWPLLCETLNRPDLATDPRFADHKTLLDHSSEAVEILTEIFASADLAAWRVQLEPFVGQWAVMQDTLEAAVDPQTIANGFVQDCVTSQGAPYKLAAAPVQFDGEAAKPGRAPDLNEHGDAILEELGLDWDAIVDLKVRGVVA